MLYGGCFVNSKHVCPLCLLRILDLSLLRFRHPNDVYVFVSRFPRTPSSLENSLRSFHLRQDVLRDAACDQRPFLSRQFDFHQLHLH